MWNKNCKNDYPIGYIEYEEIVMKYVFRFTFNKFNTDLNNTVIWPTKIFNEIGKN